MRDYERNFYLPFKGFEKPIYAIPGNHDWFDSDDGFNANFLTPDAAVVSIKSRNQADFGSFLGDATDSSNELVAEAKRLRELYRIQNGLQKAPFFDFHTEGFSLIAGDTGILRNLDQVQKEWLEASLKRAGDNFKMVILGHPLYAAGSYQADGDKQFAEIHKILRRYKVNVMMAGDTHDFEYYKEKYLADGKSYETNHFVNGGGGAYLSIGTALDYPKESATEDYAFYPRTDAVQKKLERETTIWKRPFLLWANLLDGYPLSVETLSGVFDFNRAPFFQELYGNQNRTLKRAGQVIALRRKRKTPLERHTGWRRCNSERLFPGRLRGIHHADEGFGKRKAKSSS